MTWSRKGSHEFAKKDPNVFRAAGLANLLPGVYEPTLAIMHIALRYVWIDVLVARFMSLLVLHPISVVVVIAQIVIVVVIVRHRQLWLSLHSADHDHLNDKNIT